MLLSFLSSPLSLFLSLILDSCEYCASSAVPSSTLLQPHLRSNIKLVKNALCHICLAGDANIISKKKALNVRNKSCCFSFSLPTFLIFSLFISLLPQFFYSTSFSFSQELETSNAGHYMILFRDSLSLKFKGLYGYSPKHQVSNLLFIMQWSHEMHLISCSMRDYLESVLELLRSQCLKPFSS